MTVFRALVRVLLVPVLAGLGFAALPVGSALAQTTIGQTGFTPSSCPAGVQADTNYVVTSGGTITSFSFESSPQAMGRQLAFLVLRPAGGNTYTVVGTTPLVTLGTGLEEFPASIAVEEGDILGWWHPTDLLNCAHLVHGHGGYIQSDVGVPEPGIGDTVSITHAHPQYNLNLSATLTPTTAPGLPTSKAQCMHGGWQSFGVFRNQGDCVSFVATGGRNPPSGS